MSAHWVFNAIQGSPARATSSTKTTPARHHVVVAPDGKNATFTARVTVDNYNDDISLGDVFTWTVHDVAEPGVGKDYFTYGANFNLPVITAGNIQVNG